jgi:nucleotide-binding universal stress UspA family protein
MKRFKNILAVYNHAVGDDDVLTQAIALAERNDARLTLIEVANDAASSAAQLTERRKHLSRIAVSIDREGIKVETISCLGTRFLQIVRQVLRERHDLVIMAAEGGGGFKDLFFGSTSMHLMRKCPCPVWILKPGQRANYTRILAAVDTSPQDVGLDELNVKIMDLATSLARLNESELHIIHAWQLAVRDLDTIRSEITHEMRERLLCRNELIHRKPVERLLERYALDDLQHHVHVVRGVPDSLLPQMAAEKEIDLIIMGTIRRTGIAGLLIGSTAENVLRQVECAVLTVKPEGFVTPIALED